MSGLLKFTAKITMKKNIFFTNFATIKKHKQTKNHFTSLDRTSYFKFVLYMIDILDVWIYASHKTNYQKVGVILRNS